MVRPLDESEGSSPLQGHGSWLMCEVALSSPHELSRNWQLVQGKLHVWSLWSQTNDLQLFATLSKENQRLIVYELVEFEK